MKIRSLLTVVAMLSVFLLSAGTAHAVLGVDDAVPGQDFVIPFICGVDSSNTLNTLWAVADKSGGSVLSSSFGFPARTVSHTACVACNEFSDCPFDFDYFWTNFDVVTDDCKNLFDQMGPVDAGFFVETLDPTGLDYFVGYLVCINGLEQESPPDDRYVPWVYLVDLPNGFASGLNGISSEEGIGALLGENADGAPVGAYDVFPRFYFANGLANTWDWWIFLLGENELGTIFPFTTFERVLAGVICDEQENCRSTSVPIPWEMNIINVIDFIPNVLITLNNFPTHDMGGFGILQVVQAGFNGVALENFELDGTSDIFGDIYSLFGWSYQRAESASLPITANWDVIHPIHRTYCANTDAGAESAPDNAPFDCECTGLGCP